MFWDCVTSWEGEQEDEGGCVCSGGFAARQICCCTACIVPAGSWPKHRDAQLVTHFWPFLLREMEALSGRIEILYPGKGFALCTNAVICPHKHTVTVLYVAHDTHNSISKWKRKQELIRDFHFCLITSLLPGEKLLRMWDNWLKPDY